jgi:beta-glucosidase
VTTTSRPETGLGDDYADLLAGLDLPTKVRLLTGGAAFTLVPLEAAGLAEIRVSDGPTGVRGTSFPAGPPAALFPNATLLASAWSEEVAYEVGRLLAEEALAQRIHVVLGPTINLHRTPLGGRLFEAYSEDPLLSGRLAAAYVRGLQDQRVGACLKHLIANESETNRDTVNSVVDEATLRELYLLPFEIAVTDADPWSIMAAYNDVNGVPATEQHHVNNEIVKGEWGWSGVLMSDWYATKSVAPAANGGLDLVMPGPLGPWGQALVDAVEAGEVAVATVDDHVRRLLRLADRVGALHHPPGEPRDYPADLPAPGGPERREQLTRLAAQGMTVLTNKHTNRPDGEGAVLPLDRGATVALIGRHALETIGMGGGSAQVNPPYQVSAADALTARLGDRVTVVDGVEVRRKAVAASAPYLRNPRTGGPGTHVLLYAADGALLDERHGATAMTTVALEEVFADHVTRLRIRTAVDLSGPVEIGVIGAGEWAVTHGGGSLAISLPAEGDSLARELIAPPAASRLVELPAGAGAGGEDGVVEAVVDLAHPAGTRLSDLTDGGGGTPVLTGMGTFGLTVRPAPRPAADVVDEAARAAAAADVAVVVVGVTEEQETETVDKATLRLPGEQDELVRAVAAAARRTVVVVNAATPVLMPWLDEVDAVLWAGLPGQEAGRAIAAALLGDVEPAGRLVTTFPAADGATPAWSVTPVDGDVEYREGTFIGYRGHHAGRAPAPAFWLGHGLGYATWEYSEPELVGTDPATVAVTVTNTGTRRSREVVQVYLRPAEEDQPVRLAGWRAVTVDPEESIRVEVACDPRMWRRWDTGAGTWTRLDGGGGLLVARGLGDVRATVDLPE